MATDTQRSKYYTDLREALAKSYEDKDAIKPLAVEAEINWSEVDPSGSAKSVWDDVIR